MNQNKTNFPIIKDDEIDLIALIMTIWIGRRVVFLTIGLFLVLGVFVAIFSSKEYTTSVKLMSESSQSGNLGALGGLASQFGFGGMSAPINEDNISSEYYPTIIESVPFMKDLMYYQVTIPEVDETMTLFHYFSEYRSNTIISSVKKYTVGLPFTIIGALKGDKVIQEGSDGLSSTIRLSQKEWGVYEKLISLISVDIDKNTSIITLEVKMPEDYLAAEVAGQVTNMLIEYVKEYKTEKTRNDLEFIDIQMKGAEQRFEKTQKALAQFRDQNQGSMTQMARTNEQRLQSEYELAFKIYSAIAEKYEETHIKLQEQTPVVKVIQPAVVPKEKSAPRRSLILIMSLLLGGIAGVGVLFGRIFWGRFKIQFQKMSQESI